MSWIEGGTVEHAAEGISGHVCQTMCTSYTVAALCISTSVTVSVCGAVCDDASEIMFQMRM